MEKHSPTLPKSESITTQGGGEQELALMPLVEAYISTLKYSGEATECEKSLVASNVRGFFCYLRDNGYLAAHYQPNQPAAVSDCICHQGSVCTFPACGLYHHEGCAVHQLTGSDLYRAGVEAALKIAETKWATVSVGKVKIENQAEYERHYIAQAIRALLPAGLERVSCAGYVHCEIQGKRMIYVCNGCDWQKLGKPELPAGYQTL